MFNTYTYLSPPHPRIMAACTSSTLPRVKVCLQRRVSMCIYRQLNPESTWPPEKRRTEAPASASHQHPPGFHVRRSANKKRSSEHRTPGTRHKKRGERVERTLNTARHVSKGFCVPVRSRNTKVSPYSVSLREDIKLWARRSLRSFRRRLCV